MRLTLRTLLAYLDNVLHPGDRALLAQKIDESPKAEQLKQRIMRSLERTDLSAVPPLSQDVDDANNAAEYLDNTMAPEKIADFEQACLGSDQRLAEVADCHKILSEVLTQPVHVPPNVRERAYRLAGTLPAAAAPTQLSGSPVVQGPVVQGQGVPLARSNPAAAAASPASPSMPISAGAPTAIPGGGQPAARPENGSAGESVQKTRFREDASTQKTLAERPTPPPVLLPRDLSPSGGSRLASILITFALLIVFLGALSQTIQPLLRLIGQQNTPADLEPINNAGVPAQESPAVNGGAAAGVVPDQGSPAVAKGTENQSSATDSQAKPLPTQDALQSDSTSSSTAQNRASAEVPPDAPVPSAMQPGQNPGNVPAGESPSPAGPVATVAMAESGEPKPAAPNPKDLVEPSGDKNQELGDRPPTNPSSVRMVPGGDAAQNLEPKPTVSGDVGRLIGNETLLFALDQASGQWQRVVQETPLRSPLVALSPPLYRNRMILRGGVDVTLVGAARFEIPGSGVKVPDLSIAYGRVLLGTTSANAEIHCEFRGIQGTLQLNDLESVIAMDVHMNPRLGIDPSLPDASQPVVELISVQGESQWLLPSGEAITIGAGEHLQLEEAQVSPVAVLEELPKWIDSPPPGAPTLEQFATSGLYKFLQEKAETLDLALRDATRHKRSEVVALAAQTLVQIGGADQMFGNDGVLSQVDQKANWGLHIEALLAEVARGPDHAAEVRDAISRVNAVESAILYRMLWGFTNEQLAAGEDANLVGWLDHPAMVVRVMAFDTLRRITGSTQSFRPELEGRRNSDLLKWQTLLRNGNIRWAKEAVKPPEVPDPNSPSPEPETKVIEERDPGPEVPPPPPAPVPPPAAVND